MSHPGRFLRAMLVAFGAWSAGATAAVAELPRIDAGASLALRSPFVGGNVLAAESAPTPGAPPDEVRLSAERASVLLRSLTLPGWGQACIGRPRAAWVFGVTEAAIWGSFAAFRIQTQMRSEAYQRTAQIFAGIDLSGRDEEYRRTVGSYVSSDEYNLYVVYRDAANLHYEDPVAYRAYIDEHSIGGADGWAWSSPEAFERYRQQREEAHRASIRSNTVLAAAIVNRLLSAIHAARAYGQLPEQAKSWRFEVAPVPGDDATAFTVGVATRF